MNPSPQIVILLHNSLAAIGLQHVVNESFAVAAHVVNTFDELQNYPADAIDYVVTDTQHFTEHLKVFLPRKSRTLIVVDHPVHDSDKDLNLIHAYSTPEKLSAELGRHLGECEENDTPNRLSVREVDVLRLVASGCINKEIADRLNISVNTVLTHRKNITAKLGIKSVSGLSFYAMMNGIIDPK